MYTALPSVYTLALLQQLLQLRLGGGLLGGLERGSRQGLAQ